MKEKEREYFRTGDLVECVDDTGGVPFIKGTAYLLLSFGTDDMVEVFDYGEGWDIRRFKKCSR
jgi:hypothetical protein